MSGNKVFISLTMDPASKRISVDANREGLDVLRRLAVGAKTGGEATWDSDTSGGGWTVRRID